MTCEPPLKTGLYWVRFEYTPPYLPAWSVSRWDGERWTHIGHEAEWTPEESSIVEWQGPLEPPSEFSAGKPFTPASDDRPVAIVMNHETGEVRDIISEVELRAALRYALHVGNALEFAYEDEHREALRRELERLGKFVGWKPGDPSPRTWYPQKKDGE